MGDGMPFVLEKGPVWAYYDTQFRPDGVCGDRAARLKLLNRLRRPAEKGVLDDDGNVAFAWGPRFIHASSGHADFGPLMPDLMRDHIENDWFVKWPPASGHGWLNWQTDPAEVVCKGFVRALEVSIGEPHVDLDEAGDVAPAGVPKIPEPGTIIPPAGATDPSEQIEELFGPPPKRPADTCWPIEFWWICPLPVFQCWIAWRPHPAVDSQIELVPAPADGGATGPAPGPPDISDPAGESTPAAAPIEVESGLVSFTFATPAPAWSYLAKNPAEPGFYIEDDGNGADETKAGLLGVVHLGSDHNLDDKNDDTSGLIVVSEGVETSCLPVAPPVDLSLDEDRTAEIEPVLLERAAANRHQMFNLPSLEGDGTVVTVSPFNDVGGYAEPRT